MAFLEIKNVGTNPVALPGVKLSQGIDFTFEAATSSSWSDLWLRQIHLAQHDRRAGRDHRGRVRINGARGTSCILEARHRHGFPVSRSIRA
jgi:hypothetical protein